MTGHVDLSSALGGGQAQTRSAADGPRGRIQLEGQLVVQHHLYGNRKALTKDETKGLSGTYAGPFFNWLPKVVYTVI